MTAFMEKPPVTSSNCLETITKMLLNSLQIGTNVD
jgi:hypothetical protein